MSQVDVLDPSGSTASSERDSHVQQLVLDPPNADWAHKISQFLQSQLSHPLAERDRFTYWKLCENEAHSGFATAMVSTPEGIIVSTCTVTPKRLWRNGTEQLWGEIGDTFTDSAYLRKGMFGALVNASRSRAQSAGFKIIYGLPNDQSLPGYLKKLAFCVKKDLVLDSYVLLIGTKALGVRTQASRVPLLRRLLCSSLVVGISRQSTKLITTLLSPQQENIRIERARTFGPEFDILWQRVRSGLPNAQVRDAKYLTWRYGKSPFPIIVLAAYQGAELAGYISMLTLLHNEESGFRHTIVLDWLYDSACTGAIAKILLFAAVKSAYEEGSDTVTLVASRTSPLPLPLRHAGFVRRGHEMPFIVHGNAEGREILSDPTPWHFTLSDTDSF